MHSHTLGKWRHKHNFEVKNNKAERRTLYVLLLTAATMVVEIIAGSVYGSMALLADGWHMGTHVAAFCITIFAYRYARKHAANPEYAFGTGKVNVLGGFASAIALAVVALVMVVESMQRIFDPQTIHFNESIVVAVVGLSINLISAFLLKNDHHHHHDHHDHDHNLKAAYMHVLADALTSLLAIFALLAAKFYSLNWLDPVMGIVGAAIICRWSYGLIKQTSPILLDASIDQEYKQKIYQTLESDSDNKVADIHIWKLGANHYGTIISLVTHYPKPVEYYKELLTPFDRLAHLTIEVNQCNEVPCMPENQV